MWGSLNPYICSCSSVASLTAHWLNLLCLPFMVTPLSGLWDEWSRCPLELLETVFCPKFYYIAFPAEGGITWGPLVYPLWELRAPITLKTKSGAIKWAFFLPIPHQLLFILYSNQAGERKIWIAIESINPWSAVYLPPVIWLVGRCSLHVAMVTYHHQDKQAFIEVPLYFPTSNSCEVNLFAKG